MYIKEKVAEKIFFEHISRFFSNYPKRREEFLLKTDARHRSSSPERRRTFLPSLLETFQITGGQGSVRGFKYNFPDYLSGLDVGRSRNNVAVIDRLPVRRARDNRLIAARPQEIRRFNPIL